MFDPVLDNLPQPVDGIDPRLEFLTQREQLMEDIDSICDEFFCENFPNSKEQFDELTRVLCDAVCKNFPGQIVSYL